MKKLVLILSALVACVLLSSSCEKHAYSQSSNEFRVVTPDGGIHAVKNNASTAVKKGETLYFYASSSTGERLTGGSYEPQTESTNIEAKQGTYNGEPCIEVYCKEVGTASVTLNFLWQGFKLYKSASITVNE